MASNQSGWNRPSGAAKPVQKKSGSSALAKGLVVGLLVIVGALAVFYFLTGDAKQRSTQAKSRQPIKEVEPTKAKVAATPTNIAKGVSVKLPKVERRPVLPQMRKDIAPPAPLADIVEKAKGVKPMFSTATESYISMAIPDAPGIGVPPIPISDDEDFSEDMKKAFAAPIKAEEGDDERTINRKIAVLNAKDELQELAVKEHWTLQEYVNAVREKYIADGDYLAECYETIEKAYQDPDIDDAAYIAMRDKINETLKERGIPEIMSYEEQAAEEEAAGVNGQAEPESNNQDAKASGN